MKKEKIYRVSRTFRTIRFKNNRAVTQSQPIVPRRYVQIRKIKMHERYKLATQKNLPNIPNDILQVHRKNETIINTQYTSAINV